MQLVEVSGAVRPIYASLAIIGLMRCSKQLRVCLWRCVWSVTYGRLCQWRTEGGVWGVQTPPPPPPKFRSFDKAAFDCKLSGKCLVFLFKHPN